MATKALAKFKKTINRCGELVSIYELLHQQHISEQGPPASKDVIRAVVVLSVAALDAYATDAFTEKLVPYLKRYKPDQSLVDLLHKAGLDTKEALTLITMDRPFRRIRTLIANYYSTYTTQRFDVIDELFLPYRLKNMTLNAEAKSGRKLLKASVEKLIERRHEIVHDGDYNAHGHIKDIDPEQIKKRIGHLDILVSQMDQILSSRVK